MIKYLVKHGKEGRIDVRYGFNRSNAHFEEGMFEKSSSTEAYFYQTVKYGSIYVTDIANPLFINKKWIGAVRIGLIK